LDLRTATSLLDEFKKVPGRIARPQTFMEIGGYPHYENVCSNFLAFFFDPKGPHGLGNLWLEALMSSVDSPGAEGILGGDVSVEREVATEVGNRIDLLITSETHALLIENKIFAAAANPFEDYAAYMAKLKNESGDAYQDGNKSKILLTLYPSREGTKWGFVNVTHADLAGAVRSRLGLHVSEADTRYLTLMLDFLNTIENLGKGTRMNQEFINLLAERSDEVATFLKSTAEVRSEAKAKARALEERIDLKNHPGVWVIPWQPNPNHHLVHLLQYRVPIDAESYVVVEPFVSPSGWQIRVFYRVSSKSQDHQELRRLLDEKGKPPESDNFIRPERFAYDDELDGIAAVVEDELRRVVPICHEVREEVSTSSG
jgi:hypothetical protein